jgi:hypothetical protein
MFWNPFFLFNKMIDGKELNWNLIPYLSFIQFIFQRLSSIHHNTDFNQIIPKLKLKNSKFVFVGIIDIHLEKKVNVGWHKKMIYLFYQASSISFQMILDSHPFIELDYFISTNMWGLPIWWRMRIASFCLYLHL